MIHKVSLIGCPIDIYTAYEPMEDWPAGHSVIRWEGSERLGSICSRRPAEDLPKSGPERSNTVHEHYAIAYSEAVRRILKAHPELLDEPSMRLDRGEVVVRTD